MQQCMRRDPPAYTELVLPDYTQITEEELPISNDSREDHRKDHPELQSMVPHALLLLIGSLMDALQVQDCASNKYSCLCILSNNSQFKLSLRSDHTNGSWMKAPPKSIYPAETAAFACVSDSMLRGISATVAYAVCVNDGDCLNSFRIEAAVPAVGRNSAKVSAPEYVSCVSNKGGGDNCINTFEISSNVQDRKALMDMRKRELETEEMKRAAVVWASMQKFQPNRKGSRSSNQFNNSCSRGRRAR